VNDLPEAGPVVQQPVNMAGVPFHPLENCCRCEKRGLTKNLIRCLDTDIHDVQVIEQGKY
jgi:hypothetical protein